MAKLRTFEGLTALSRKMSCPSPAQKKKKIDAGATTEYKLDVNTFDNSNILPCALELTTFGNKLLLSGFIEQLCHYESNVSNLHNIFWFKKHVRLPHEANSSTKLTHHMVPYMWSILSKWDASVQDPKWRYGWKYLWGWFLSILRFLQNHNCLCVISLL